MNEYTITELEPGMKASFQKKITKEMEDLFRTISGDENPLHWDDEFAREISDGRFHGHAAFGMLTASLYSTMAGIYLPGKYSLIHSFDELSFMRPVFVDDVLTVEGRVIGKDVSLKLVRLNVVIKNQNNISVSKAKIKVLVMR